MKKLIILAISFTAWFGGNHLHAQTLASEPPDSIVQLTAEAQGLSVVARADLPPFGTYWLVLPRGAAPLPCPPMDQSLLIYAITAGQFIVDGTGGQATSTNDLMVEAATVVNLINQAQSVQSRRMARTMSPNGGPLPPGAGGGGGVTNTYTFNGVSLDTNRLWVSVEGVGNGQVQASLHHATNFVYAVKSAESLLTPPGDWNIETEVFPADTNRQPFTVATLGRDTLFLKAEDLTGVFTNGLPAWWSWLYFGDLSQTATNRDGLGISLGYDYTNGLDPNIIQFSLQFTNHYFNTSPAHGTITVAGGSPYYLAVLVNDTNYGDAVWLPCTSTNVTVPLVGGDGIYQVQIGLRGLPADAQPTWLEAGLTLDTHPPVITLTNPVAGTVSTPMIQVQGFANESLGSLTFDVSNASGWFPDQAGYVIRQIYDTNLLKFTTNWFQCYDVALTNGVNVITLHATDLAGNMATTNVNCTLNYAGVSNAPVLAVIWPSDGTRVAADQFTLQAQVDDATATVTATVNGHAVPGQIERSGQVWLPGLSLNSGTNVVTITAVNGAGNRSSTNLSVIGSAAGLTVAPLAGQLNQPTVTVTGTVADPGDQVTVNGVAGYVYDAAGDWLAYGVPVNVTGTADLNVALTDDDFNPLGELKVGQPQPAMIALMSYQSFAHDTYVGVGEGDGHDDQTYLWDYQSGGRNWGDSFLENQGDDDHDYSYDYPIAAGLGALEGYVPSPVNKNISAAGTFNNVLPYYSSFKGVYGPYSQQAQAQLMIVPSGQGLLGTTRLYLVGLSALAFSDPFTAQSIRQAGDVPVDPATLQVNGQPLTRSGHTNADGSMTGLALVAGPAGAPVPLTVTSSAAVNYSFATNRLQEVHLAIMDTNSGVDLTQQTNTVIVGQQMNWHAQLALNDGTILTNYPPANFHWTVPGFAISNYVVAVDSSSAAVVTNFPLNNSNVVFYWVDGASNRVVQCSATVNGKTIVGQATFNVLRPTAKISAWTTSVNVYSHKLEFVDTTRPNGITFSNTITIPAGFSGSNLWMQVCYYRVRQLQDTNLVWHKETENGSSPYGDTPIPYTAGLSSGINPVDTPNQPLPDSGYLRCDATNTFTMWMMFQPTNGIPVPLRAVNWFWSGSATNVPFGGGPTVIWELERGTNSVNPNDFDTQTFPIWNSDIQNRQWIPPGDGLF